MRVWLFIIVIVLILDFITVFCCLRYLNLFCVRSYHTSLMVKRVSLVEQELFNLPGAPEFTPDFKSGSCYSFYSFICMFCRSLFVLLYFFFWPLCCLSLFDLRNMITPLVSSNSSFTNLSCNGILKRFLNLMSSMHMLRFLSFDFERT